MNNKKVLLIYPPSPVMNREERCQQPTDDLIVIPPLPPLDMLYLASIARKYGYEPRVKDYSFFNETLEDFKRDIERIRPRYLIVNAATVTLESDLAVLKAAKEILGDEITTIAKGAHFNFLAREVMQTHDFIDIAFCSECELTFGEILQGRALGDIDGLCFREEFEIIQTKKRAFNDNLDELPYPARDLIDNSLYIRPDNGKKQAVIKVSRGCPYHCFFCLATPLNGAIVRKRSPKNIVGEIRECVEKYGIKNFIFWSDIFNLDKEWTRELCREIINSKLKIIFSTNTRADSADIETIKLMKKAGCRLVSIGIESGSQELLDKMGKKITLEQVRKTVKSFKKFGIQIYAYYVVGLPWETKETILKTLEFAKSLNTEYVSFYTAAALVGTRFYDYVEQNKLGELNYERPYYYPSVNTHTLSKDEVFKLHKKIVRSYYLRPLYILKMLFAIRSLKQFENYFKAGLKILFHP